MDPAANIRYQASMSDRPRLPATLLGRFRWIALLEGVSYLLLLFIAMPLKYFADMPLAVRVTGMAHGVLFIAYGGLVALLLARGTFSFMRASWAMLMSLVPFGTFVLDRQLARDETTETA
jgi:integral membrane protein